MNMEEMGINLQDLFGNLLPKKTKRRKVTVRRSARPPDERRGPEAHRPGRSGQGGRLQRVENSGIVFLDEIDKIAGDQEPGGRTGCLARRRPARPAPDRRGLQRDDQVRDGQDRSRPVHRLGSVPRRQAFRPHPGTAGPFPHPRGTEQPDRGGFHQDPHAAAERADEAVRGPAGNRRCDTGIHARTASGKSPGSPRK